MSARKDRLLPELRSLLEDASGLDLDGSDPAATFLELGLDSLFLTQFALAVQSKYGAKVAFRQLLEQIPSLAALAHHLDKTLPPEAAPPPAPLSQFAQLSPIPDSNPIPNPTAASVAPATAPAGSVQAVIEEQLRLMSRQLDLLRGAPPAQPAVASAPAINAPAMTEAVQIAAAPPVIAAPRPPVEDASHQKYDPKKAFGAIARIHTHHEELTPKQKARLEALIRRYTARTRRSKEFTEQNRARLSDPRVVTGFRPAIKELVYPIVVSRSKGARMWDLDGNDYVDALNGFGSNFFGYQPDFIAQALKEQIDLGYEVGPQHPLAAECADLVCDLTGHDRAAFCNTGSEAVLGCVRIARTVTGRRLVAFFSGSYHGIFDEVVARAGKKKSIPGAPGIMPSAMENSLILDYGTPESLQILKERAGELAAILVEPIQSRRPDFQPREFLHELRKLTEQSGTALIFDEVITGFRLHQGGAQAHFGVQADLASYGKVVSAGIPIGVIAGKKSWMDALDGGPWKFGDRSVPSVGVTYFAGTFVRHPLALAACKAALAYLKEQGPGLQQKLNERTTAMVAELNAFCRKVSAPIEVRSFSSLWKAFYLDEQPFGDLLFVLMRDRGVHILDGFPCFLTIAHGEEEVARIVTAFKESVIELQESGFLPGASKPAGAVDPAAPPAPGARLGRDPSGNPAWYVPHASEPGKFVKIDA